MKYNIYYEEDKFHEVELVNERIKLDGKETNIDLIKLLDNKYHILDNHQSYNLEILHIDYVLKRIAIKINNNIYDLNVQTELDILLDKMGMTKSSSDKMECVKAPMPGLVLDILVDKGQAIKKGDSLLILEAMKMENILKATGTGIVKNINVNKKDAVEKNQVLIEME